MELQDPGAYPYIGLQGQRVFSYRAPSWSWASIDFRVDLWGEEQLSRQESEDTWAQVLDVQLQLLDSDPLGQLSIAQLRLSCLCLVDVGVKIIPIVSTATGEIHAFLTVNDRSGSLYCRISFDRSGGDVYSYFKKVKAMPVFNRGEFGVTGLLLEPTGEQRGQYQRIGWFSFFFSSLSNRKDFASYMVKPCYQAAEEECLEIQKDKDGNTQRVITLV